MIVGHLIVALAIVHAAAFVFAFRDGHPSSLAGLFSSTRAGVTGTLLVAISATMWLAALPFVRSSGRFEVLNFTHLLYGPWLLILLWHSPRTLFWLGLPLAGFIVELALRKLRRGCRAQIVALTPLRTQATPWRSSARLGLVRSWRQSVPSHPEDREARVAPFHHQLRAGARSTHCSRSLAWELDHRSASVCRARGRIGG